MTDWQIRSLGDCVTLFSGGTPSKSQEDYWGGDIPWVSNKDMKTVQLCDSEDHLTELGAKSGTRLVPPQTILIVVRGMALAKVFPVAMTMCQMAFNQDLKAIVPAIEQLDNQFLFYWLRGSTDRILGIVDEAAHGTTRIQTDRLMSLPISLPPLPIQHRIASILSAYDDLIENNTQRIKALEAAAQALYREWFVEFRFPGWEQVEWVEKGEWGMLPDGWEPKKLKDVPIEIIDGDRSDRYPKSDEFQDYGVLFLSTRNIVNNRLDLSSTNHVSEEKYEQITKGRLLPNDIVMTTRGSIGKVAIFRSLEHRTGLINAQMLLLRAEGIIITPYYLFYLLAGEEFQAQIRNFASGSAQPQIPIQDLREIEFVCPPSTLQAEFSDFVSRTEDLIEVLQARNLYLRQTRDLLLPRLISGEVSVG